jgi:predicted RNA-binding Zn-ribbon protein involved in translation (DUF1610 family)
MTNDVEQHEIVSALKNLAIDLKRSPTWREALASKAISDYSIRKYGWSKLLAMAGLLTNRRGLVKKISPQDDSALIVLDSPEQVRSLPEKPKILFIDIETAPINALVWGIWDQTVGLSQIKEDWFILAYAARFMGEDKVYYLDQRYATSMSDDLQIITAIHYLLEQADIVIGHNVDKFDLKKINARILYHDFQPPKKYRSIDTLKIAKKYFALTSNKLEWLAKFLKLNVQKLTHRKFQGQELWNECLNRNFEAWEEMEHYNKMDVFVLEEVYRKLIPWHNSINFSIFEEENTCSCGHKEFAPVGQKITNAGKFMVFKCNSCGSETVGRDNLLNKDIKKSLFKV